MDKPLPLPVLSSKPAPDERTLLTPPRFWNQRAAAYAKKPVADEAAYEQTIERVKAYLTPSDSVLELGCGTGTTALKLAGSARDILATDYSEQMIAIANAKARSEGVTHVRFRSCTLDDAALAPGSFDVVMAMNLLHLLDDVPARLTRIRQLLRPGGVFISKTPCIGDRGFFLRLLIPVLRAIGRAPYVNFVTERSLRADIAAAGFDVLETGMYPQKWRGFMVVARKPA